MSLKIKDPKALAALENACSILIPNNHNKPDPVNNVKVIALLNNKKTEGFAQTDTLSHNNIMFKYEQPQLLFLNRMEYMEAFVGKNQWCYPSEERCRFREDGKRCCIHS